MADGLALGSQLWLWLDWKLDVVKAKTKHTNVAIHFCRYLIKVNGSFFDGRSRRSPSPRSPAPSPSSREAVPDRPVQRREDACRPRKVGALCSSFLGKFNYVNKICN